MKHLEFSFDTTVTFSEPVSDHYFVLRCLPTNGATQRVKAELKLGPSCTFCLQHDSFGNQLAVGSLAEAHTCLSYRVNGTAEVDLHGVECAEAHPLLRFESALTQADDALRHFLVCQNVARSFRTLETCSNLMHAVYDFMEYAPGSTNTKTTASAAFAQGKGVCQDFAHILICLLRLCGIPTRYVSGLTVGEGATHAWVQAYVDKRWVGLDPTRNKLVDESYLVIAIGRDWYDCPIEQGTFSGAATQTQSVLTVVSEA